jgi:hypothetical protein
LKGHVGKVLEKVPRLPRGPRKVPESATDSDEEKEIGEEQEKDPLEVKERLTEEGYQHRVKIGD